MPSRRQAALSGTVTPHSHSLQYAVKEIGCIVRYSDTPFTQPAVRRQGDRLHRQVHETPLNVECPIQTSVCPWSPSLVQNLHSFLEGITSAGYVNAAPCSFCADFTGYYLVLRRCFSAMDLNDPKVLSGWRWRTAFGHWFLVSIHCSESSQPMEEP